MILPDQPEEGIESYEERLREKTRLENATRKVNKRPAGSKPDDGKELGGNEGLN